MLYIKYLKYLLRHKLFVMLECFKRGYNWRGLMHDMSKFFPDEFIPYARYFYGNYPSYENVKRFPCFNVTTKEDIEKEFDMAWLKHQKRNKHHWQYWLLPEDSGNFKFMPIPRKYLIEMLCDWVGAGRAIHGNTGTYYETIKWIKENYDKIKIDDRDKLEILRLLGVDVWTYDGLLTDEIKQFHPSIAKLDKEG